MTTPTAPSLWGAGVEWGPAETAGADAYWLADDWADGLTGRPHGFVSIAGQLVNGFGDESVSLQSGSWSLGRSDWFDVLSPNSASFTFAGVVDAATGDEVVASTEGGVLWVGNVNRCVQTQDVSGQFHTTVTGTDAVGRLGKAFSPPGSIYISAGPKQGDYGWIQLSDTLDAIARDYLATYGGGTAPTVVVGDSAGTLPTLNDWTDPPDGLTLLALLNTCERSSNAMMALQPDGSIVVTMREALSSTNLFASGTFEVDTSGWTLSAGSATIARSTSSPIAGTASGRISATASAFSGRGAPVSGTFEAGRTYRLSLSIQYISGDAGSWYIGFDTTSRAEDSYVDVTPTGTAATVTVDWTPNVTRTDVEIWVGHNAASASVMAIDSVTVTDIASLIDLSGIDAPYTWTKDTSADNVINHWVLTKPSFDATVVLDESDADSVALYGDRAYAVDDYLCSSAAHFGSGLKAAMAEPRPLVTDGRFHVTDLSQRVLYLAPLSWVRQGDDTWQVMSVRHEFSAGAVWDVVITADVSQNAMVGAADPDTTDPSGTLTSTQTLVSTKSATVFLSSGGSKQGNGAGDYLAVGRYSGTISRACIGFTSYAIPANFVRVKKATLALRTGTQAWVAFGSSPKFYARRITESWSEGTFNAAAPNQYSVTNSVVYPGPGTTTSGQALKGGFGRTTSKDITVDVTDLVDAAFQAGVFHGIKLVSANEDSSAGTVEFCSDDHGTAAARPTLTIVCEVSA